MRLPYKQWKDLSSVNKKSPKLMLNGRLRFLKKPALTLYKSKLTTGMSTSRKIQMVENIHLKQLEGKIDANNTKTRVNVKVKNPVKKSIISSIPKKRTKTTKVSIKKTSTTKKLKEYSINSSEYKFYMSLLCQKPNSQMAKSWIGNHGILDKQIKKYCKELTKKI
jgi:hypothetical protein